MNFDKEIIVNLGNCESLKLRVNGAESFQDSDYELNKELERLGLQSKVVKTEVVKVCL